MWTAVPVLTVALLVAHGLSLRDGLFLDDHLHQARLKQVGWSLSELLSVTTIAPDDFTHCWWQDKSACWQYARPVSVLLMKAVQVATGGSAAAQHLVSLLLHAAGVLLVLNLAMRVTGDRFWSLFGALLFAMYTHSIIPVGWLASQNAILQTTLTLAAITLYARASGLRLSACDASLPADSVDSLRAALASDAARVAPPLHVPSFAGVLALSILAILSREVAVVIPVLAVALDAAFGGWAHAWRRRWTHLVLAAPAVAFAVWRLAYFYAPIPDFYARSPDSPGFALWWLAKLMHYLCSSVWLTPMTVGPTGRFNPFSEVPTDCALMFVILAVMSTGYYCACRNIRGWWFWPVWILVSVLPVTPIMATPHNGYMAGAGFAIAMVIGPALRRRSSPIFIGRWSRPVAGWFMFATLFYVVLTRILWIGLQAAETQTVDKLARLGPPASSVEHVYFLNLPFINIYAPVQLHEAWGGQGPADKSGPNRRYDVLCYAPDLLAMESDCVVEQLDARRFTIETAGRPYFYGALGRYLIEAMRSEGRLRAGDEHAGDEFTVRVAAADEQGVRKLEFEFREPLDSPRYAFYLTTSDCPASRLTFASSAVGRASTSFVGRASLPAAVLRTSLPATAGTEAGPTGDQVQQPPSAVAARPPSAGSSDSQAPPGAFPVVIRPPPAGCTDEFADLRRAKDRVYAVRDLVAKAVRSDLYFTGPPYPGPK